MAKRNDGGEGDAKAVRIWSDRITSRTHHGGPPRRQRSWHVANKWQKSAVHFYIVTSHRVAIDVALTMKPASEQEKKIHRSIRTIRQTMGGSISGSSNCGRDTGDGAGVSRRLSSGGAPFAMVRFSAIMKKVPSHSSPFEMPSNLGSGEPGGPGNPGEPGDSGEKRNLVIILWTGWIRSRCHD